MPPASPPSFNLTQRCPRHWLKQVRHCHLQQTPQKVPSTRINQGPFLLSATDSAFLSGIFQALKALALVRSQKIEESLVLCEEVLELKPTSDATLTAMMHVLRGLGRREVSRPALQ